MLKRAITQAALTAVALVASLFISPAHAIAVDIPPGCYLAYNDQRLPYVVCQNSDSGGGSTGTPPSDAGSSGSSNSGDSGDNGGSGGSGASAPDEPVSYTTYDEVQCVSPPSQRAAPAGVTIQGTRVPTSVVMWCESTINGGPPFYYWSTPAAAPPPVDLAALARQARALLPIPTFELKFGPDPQRLAVNMKTSFTAVPQQSMAPGDLTKTANDQGITVTVTAQLQSITWQPGEPAQCVAGDRTKPCTDGKVGAVACPDTQCSYTYRWVSSPARTGGAPVWEVSANATWGFSYTTTGNGPSTGQPAGTWTETLPAGNGAVSVGEWGTAGGFS